MTREELDRLFESRRSAEAFAALRRAWLETPDLSTALHVISKFERHRDAVTLTPQRVFIARTFAVEPLVPLLRAAAYTNGIDLMVQLGEFNAYAAEILDPQSALYRGNPQIVILATNTASIAPALWEPANLSEQAMRDEGDAAFTHLHSLITAFRKHSEASLIVHSLDQPDTTPLGVRESSTFGQRKAIASVNERMSSAASSHRGVYVLDYDALVARHGRRAWWDALKWERYRVPATAANLRHLADAWLRFIHPLSGVVAKVAAVDLDNTLWGGIVGEDGFAGIRMGSELAGTPYRSLQRALLALRERGIILAICSKNNETDAMEVLQRHPDMLLRPEHFAAIRINWESKSENLRALAAQLNVGLDAVAFIDDNPVECAEVQAALPEIRIIQLPGEPVHFAQTILDFPPFERLEVSSEDAARTQYYREQQLRDELLSTVTSKEAFLVSLKQEAEIASVSPVTLARTAQLTQKTNQFNLTTRRYSQEHIARFVDDVSYTIRTIRVKDRFGDNGIVGVAITRDDGDACEIDTFLLSCRVIGRGIETALVAQLADEARARGASRLIGTFIQTPKNAPAQNFYEDHGFTCIARDTASSTWEFPLDRTIDIPQWVTVTSLGSFTA
ncbi:MAG: HAD family hydrolase [Candidatus Eremiobacteraeota bacterium]|nr:HAD family hydrolase [Candidatus Eremiobacteraeota bacterium]